MLEENSQKQEEVKEQDEYKKQIAKEHGFEKEKNEQSSPDPEIAKASPDQKDSSKNTTMAFVAYIFFVIPLLTDSKNDLFVKYHVKQSLGLLIAWIAISIFSIVPIIGWVFGPILAIAVLVLWVLGVLNALQGEQKPLPLIGEYAEKLNI